MLTPSDCDLICAISARISIPDEDIFDLLLKEGSDINVIVKVELEENHEKNLLLTSQFLFFGAKQNPWAVVSKMDQLRNLEKENGMSLCPLFLAFKHKRKSMLEKLLNNPKLDKKAAKEIFDMHKNSGNEFEKMRRRNEYVVMESALETGDGKESNNKPQ